MDNSLSALFHINCPSCGAPVDVYSATTITVVCPYCQSQLIYHDHHLHDTGRDSALLEDFSPLHLGVQGRFMDKSFTLIGRLQVQYDAGIWNEWYIAFDDGSFGWLSEVGDLYTLVQSCEISTSSIPEFDRVIAGVDTLRWSKIFVASDKRHIQLARAHAEGELPFELPEHYENRVIDWRCENALLTLDYSQDPPLSYFGFMVELSQLSLIYVHGNTEPMKLKGQSESKSCPQCGSSVYWQAGVTPIVICPSCGSELNVSTEDIQLMQANVMRIAQQDALTLPLGKKGQIDNIFYIVVGAVHYEEIHADDAQAILNGDPKEGIKAQGFWREYLLYSRQNGFLWLIETEDAWRISHTLRSFPSLDHNNQPKQSQKLYDYGGRVTFAVGAFYWQIRAGDVNVYQDYQKGNSRLCAERSRNELAWSSSTAISYQDMMQAFHISIPESGDEQKIKLLRGKLISVYIFLNLSAWFEMDLFDLVISFIVSCMVILFLWVGKL